MTRDATVRIAVSLRWDDAFDAATTHRITDAVQADRFACLQGPGPTTDSPDLCTVLDEVADISRIELVGWTSIEGPAPLSWLRRVAGHWLRSRSDAPEVVVSTGVYRLGSSLGDQWRPVTGTEAPLRSPTWEEFPPFRHHLLACRGPRCSAHNAAALHTKLIDALDRVKATDDDVLVTYTGCMFPCNHAPLVVIWPDGRCRRLTEDTIDEVVADLTNKSL